MEAGRPHGLANAGYRAIETLRLEKGYRAWGADIGPDHTPLDGRARLGGEAAQEHSVPRPRGASRRRATGRCRACSPASPSTTRTSSCSAARRSTATASASAGCRAPASGYTVERTIGYGYVRDADGVDADYVTSGRYELEVATERVPAEVFLQAALRSRHDAHQGLTDMADRTARIVIIGGGAIGCLDRLPPRPRRRARRAAPREGAADPRLDLARRRPRRPAPLARRTSRG